MPLDDLLTLSESAVFLKALAEEHGPRRVVRLNPKSLERLIRSGSHSLVTEVVDGTLHIRRGSLLRMFGLDAGPEVMPEPKPPQPVAMNEPAQPRTLKRGTRGCSCPEIAEILVELRAIRELLSKSFGGASPERSI